MKVKSEFIILKHFAKKAGEHWDIRVKQPTTDIFDSYATRKEIPTEPGTKILCFYTTPHTRKEAYYTGKIEQGYGAGTLKEWDSGSCDILKYSERHIVIDFHGQKIKGVYHFIYIKFDDKHKQKSYLFFKGKSNDVDYDKLKG